MSRKPRGIEETCTWRGAKRRCGQVAVYEITVSGIHYRLCLKHAADLMTRNFKPTLIGYSPHPPQ